MSVVTRKDRRSGNDRRQADRRVNPSWMVREDGLERRICQRRCQERRDELRASKRRRDYRRERARSRALTDFAIRIKKKVQHNKMLRSHQKVSIRKLNKIHEKSKLKDKNKLALSLAQANDIDPSIPTPVILMSWQAKKAASKSLRSDVNSYRNLSNNYNVKEPKPNDFRKPFGSGKFFN